MQLRQKIQVILVCLMVTLFYQATLPTPVSAACGGDCSVEKCNCYLAPGPDGVDKEYCDWCTACGGSCESGQCPSGMYRAPDGSCHDIGDGDGDTCFPAGTQISMADGSKKNIEEVEVGERVMSQSASGVRGSSTVTNLIQPVSDNMCEIKLEGADDLKVTNSHPLATVDGWKAIDTEAAARERESVAVTKLEVGDRMVGVDGSNPRVESIKCWDERVQTYNITVDNDHTYFAGGYLAHNKGGIGRGGCVAPQNVNCSANTACVPGHNFYCSTYNVNYNSSSTSVFDGPAGNETCRLGNAQTSSRRCHAWFCGYDVTTYTCCPSGTVSSYSYSYETYTILKYPDASAYNCYPDVWISTVQSSVYGGTHRVCEGEDGGPPCGQQAWYYMRTTCRKRITTYSCTSVCNSTAPTNLSVVQGASVIVTTLSWKSGTGVNKTHMVHLF